MKPSAIVTVLGLALLAGCRTEGLGVDERARRDGGTGDLSRSDAAFTKADLSVVSSVVPDRHRASAVACSMTRPPVQKTPVTDPVEHDDCAQDSDCTAGTNGRCTGGSFHGRSCTYDVCFNDADCAAGTLCDCNGRETGSAQATSCKRADCRIDADCGANGYCSPSYGSCGAYSGYLEWRCHTPSDTCVNDRDCRDGSAAKAQDYCAYMPQIGAWRCSSDQCAG